MIKISRRDWIAGAMASTALLCARPAAAQAYPQRPVRIIVPYAPGGGTDVFSRLLAAQMEREFGQTLIVDNAAAAEVPSAPRRSRTRSPTAIPSGWWTAPS